MVAIAADVGSTSPAWIRSSVAWIKRLAGAQAAHDAAVLRT